MVLRKIALAAPIALAACGEGDNKGDKIGDYTCRIQEGASQVLQTQDPTSKGNQIFVTDQSLTSRFEHRETPYRLPNIFNQTGGLEIYFITNQASLDNGDKSDLDQIASQINNIGGSVTILLEGYADARGNERANERMATRRIESVETYIRTQLNPGVEVIFEHASFGETQAQQDISNLSHEELLELRPDRKVVVSISGNTITAGLDRSPADTYILDASGSMDGRSWNIVSNYSYPDDSTVYTFTDTQRSFDDDDCANSLNNQTVNGQTPLLISIMDVIQTGEYDNRVITLLSDGGDNVGSMRSSEVIGEAKNRGITINVVGIGSADIDLLRSIAESTGGRYTFER